ncbi:MAG: AmmeMemoRadiSam system protein B [Balneolales bacterium]
MKEVIKNDVVNKTGNNVLHSRNGKALLVDDVDKNLPPIRAGIEIIPITNQEEEFFYFHDPEEYMEKPFVLNKEIAALLPLFNGNYSIRDIVTELKQYGSEVEESHILSFMHQLDEARLLLSPRFKQHKKEVDEKFEKAGVRPAICAGHSYPAEKGKLEKLLKKAFSESDRSGNPSIENKPVNKENAKRGEGARKRIKALFAPHIDLRVGLPSYISAFRSLAGIKPSRVIILATSHYSGMYHPTYEGKPFIVTRKEFKTPLGTVQADQDALNLLESNALNTGCTFQDRAHRVEHSIELHLIFLQHLWSHPFRIVPILVGSLEEMYYVKHGEIGNKVMAMASLLENYFGTDDQTLFLISGDLAHFGKKFGDQHTAASLFEKVKIFDHTFLECAKTGDRERMLEIIKKEEDPYRICGFPPLYTALTALPGIAGKVTGYEFWDEHERESAVTFGSVLYHQDINE